MRGRCVGLDQRRVQCRAAGLRPAWPGLLATGAWLRLALSDLRVEESIAVADDRHVLSVVTRHAGPLTQFRDGKLAQVIPPTGREIAVRQVHIHGLRGGEVVTHSAVRDDGHPDARVQARADHDGRPQ